MLISPRYFILIFSGEEVLRNYNAVMLMDSGFTDSRYFAADEDSFCDANSEASFYDDHDDEERSAFTASKGTMDLREHGIPLDWWRVESVTQLSARCAASVSRGASSTP